MLALLAIGCTLEPGTGFATLSEVEVVAELRPGEARDLGNDTVLTDLGYQVKIDVATVDLASLTLEELQGGIAFDPADPPEGYGLCHGGHCHADDGSLVDYADIEAELAGDAASYVTVVTVPVDQALDLLAGEALVFDTIEPSSELPAATIRRTSAAIVSMLFEGSVTGPGLEDPTPWSASPSPAEPLAGAFDLDIGRDGPTTLALTATLAPDGTLFDGIDFLTLAESGDVTLATLKLDSFEPLMELQ